MTDGLKSAVDKKSKQVKSKDKTGHVERLEDQVLDNGSEKSQKKKKHKRLHGHVVQNEVQEVERKKTKKGSVDSKEDFNVCETSMQPDKEEQPTEEANDQAPMSVDADPICQSEKKKKKKRRYEEVDINDKEQSKSELKRDRKEKKRQKQDGLSSTFSSLFSTPVESSFAPSKDTSPHPTYTPSSFMSPQFAKEAEAFLTKHSIKIHTPEGVPRVAPLIKFSQLNVPAEIQSAFSGFKEPTPIQACTWPPALEGRDVVGIAETGSGKTLAFGIPALCHLLKSHTKHDKSTVSVLVVAPTRELALQTHDTLTSLGAPFGIASVAVFGGVPKEPQVKMLKNASRGKDGMTTKIIVGTPGRILDLMQEGACDLSGVDYLVLDEADRMLDKGFENDIRNIISSTRPQEHRQTMMFSATWPEAVRRLASTFQRNPVRVTVGSDDLTANSRVEQSVDVFDDSRSKDQRLLNTLKSLSHKKKTTSSDESRILVFALYKKEASRVEQMLRRQGYTVGALHGDMSQNARLEALENFKNGTTGLMVATDVAARGLDIPNVGAVVNYTFPLTIEDYIHRIGRTGRGGRSGKSITFFTGDAHEKALAGELARVLRESGFECEGLKKFPMTIKKREHGAYGAFYRDDIPMPKGPTKIVF